MANAKPTVQLPEWGYDPANKTQKNAALVTPGDFDFPAAGQAQAGWSFGDAPPFNWQNANDFSTGAHLRWLSENIAASFLLGHWDFDEAGLGGAPASLGGYHLEPHRIMINAQGAAAFPTKKVVSTVNSNIARGVPWFTTARDETPGTGTHWLCLNAIWDEIAGNWAKTVLGQKATAIRMTMDGIKFFIVAAGLNTWADADWKQVAVINDLPSPGASDNGSLEVDGVIVQLASQAKAGSGDLVGPQAHAAADNTGYWFPPNFNDGVAPTGTPDQHATVIAPALVTERTLKRLYSLFGGGSWGHIPLAPVMARYDKGPGVFAVMDGNPAPRQSFVDFSDFATYEQEAIGRQRGSRWAVASVVAGGPGLGSFSIIAGSDVTALFPVGSMFKIDSCLVNNGEFTVASVSYSAPNTIIVPNEAVNPAGAGFLSNWSWVSDRDGRFRLSFVVPVAAPAVLDEGRAFFQLFINGVPSWIIAGQEVISGESAILNFTTEVLLTDGDVIQLAWDSGSTGNQRLGDTVAETSFSISEI